ncbi:MAG: hypothetical protein GF416_03375 [Candidatus Altiarchaeales archaeon]|nr:hypothetical protein [Candidatus Altiarchaeales archaeon]MBD3416160.1 hypothetical protein [Candidatus Altiarchaeales archaeon]
MMDLIGWLSSMLHGSGRYVSSRHSREHLYHSIECECPYLKNIQKGNKIFYRNRDRAASNGLKYCRICRQQTMQKTLKDYT